jgi:hypothetical protein
VSAWESGLERNNELTVISAENFQNLYQYLAMYKSLLSRFLYTFGAFVTVLQEQSSGVSKTVILMLSPLCPEKSLLIV